MGGLVPARVGDWLDVVLCLAALITVVRFRSHLAAVVLLLALDPLWATVVARSGLEARALPIVGAFAVHVPLWIAFVLGLARLARADRRRTDGAERSPTVD